MKKSVLEKEMPESESKKKLCVLDENESKDVWLVRKWKEERVIGESWFEVWSTDCWRRPRRRECSRSEIFSAIFSKMCVQVLGQQIKWYFELCLIILIKLTSMAGRGWVHIYNNWQTIAVRFCSIAMQCLSIQKKTYVLFIFRFLLQRQQMRCRGKFSAVTVERCSCFAAGEKIQIQI